MTGRPCLALRCCECPKDMPEGTYSNDCRACRYWVAQRERAFRAFMRMPERRSRELLDQSRQQNRKALDALASSEAHRAICDDEDCVR